MSKETAVEWLEKEIKSYIEYPIPIRSYSQIFYWFYQAKQKEKEQIEKAFNEGGDWSQDYSIRPSNIIPVSAVYYDKTYGGDHE
jgi:hypothetical protein